MDSDDCCVDVGQLKHFMIYHIYIVLNKLKTAN